MILFTKNRVASLFISFFAAFLLYSNEHLKVTKYDLLGSKFFPRVLCIIIIVLGIVLFFIKDEKDENSQKQKNNSYLSVVFFLILSLSYLLALNYNFGFLISSILYVFVFTFMLSNDRFKDFLKITLFAIVSCYVIYYFFQNILMLMLP